MKRIMLAVEVPDGYNQNLIQISCALNGKAEPLNFQIITPPTDEELSLAWFTFDDSQKYDAYLQEQGAKWMRDEIFGEGSL